MAGANPEFVEARVAKIEALPDEECYTDMRGARSLLRMRLLLTAVPSFASVERAAGAPAACTSTILWLCWTVW